MNVAHYHRGALTQVSCWLDTNGPAVTEPHGAGGQIPVRRGQLSNAEACRGAPFLVRRGCCPLGELPQRPGL